MPTLRAFQLPSKRLILSYVLDWIVIIAIAGVGGGFNRIGPYRRPFSLVDLNISYPYTENDQVSWWVVLIVALIGPGVIIFLTCLFFVPGPRAIRTHPWSLVWRRKFWEWNTGWMGLGLSLATAFMITEGLKNLFGKPRPDLLARCQPDVDNIEQYVVGGYGQDISPKWVRVSAAICMGPNTDEITDGFRSFPSGHSSFAWAGLLYLTLFVCSKFAISIPFLPPRAYSTDSKAVALEAKRHDRLPLHEDDETSIIPIRNQAAAPPNYLLVLALVPVGTAAYIASTRYSDYRHHGIDIFAGSLIGIATAWFSFRWYHLPIQQGAGWAWGARSRDRAFGIGVGTGNYVGTEGWGPAKSSQLRDEESGRNGILGPGLDGQQAVSNEAPSADSLARKASTDR
ncbi:PAP2 domain-containing protein [Pseudovirgaria hyperparasitica]|uniref:PAP2 domain-containing protein n=1 Tax=Pseudovirgaria hyperparasitica TaxID=470096 RepID=A0A6A6WIB6_9PEZI|nr:PAP2 domain-containing protein [Pseudovirgaria hyperparasitica]KAF2761989.1 PAP2 domain-containing protein [Pseudovirgaria hyperparasitica]